MKRIKILIVDNHAILRMGLASLLETQKNLEIVRTTSANEIGKNGIFKVGADVLICIGEAAA